MCQCTFRVFTAHASRPRTAARSDVLPHHPDEVRVLSEEDARRAVKHGEHGEVALRRLRECAVQRGHSRAVDLVRVRVRIRVRVRGRVRVRARGRVRVRVRVTSSESTIGQARSYVG